MNSKNILVEQVRWKDKEETLRHIRTVVFIDEQNVPEELEWDEYDEACQHFLASIGNDVIATGRLLDSGKIGRMAVLKPYRNQGVGSKVLESILTVAKEMKMISVFLFAQIDAINFYKRFGFEEEGAIFDDAGIPHKKMNKQL